MLHEGSCLCGRVQYQIRGQLKDVINCHCSMCRKLHASAFRTRATILASNWSLLRGQEWIKYYESSPGNHKAFCSNCGSSLYTKFDKNPAVYGFPLGTLDTDPKVAPERHIFVKSKAPWYEITDDLPQFDAHDYDNNRN